MMVFLRFVGMVNAAIWLGGAVFFTFFAGPAFFSSEMAQILAGPYPGAVAQVVMKRYFLFHHVCGLIALAHLFAEWLYMGRPLQQLGIKLVLTLFLAGLLGGLWLQPKLKALHLTAHTASTLEECASAKKSFGLWHGVAQTINLLMLAGLLSHFWRVANASTPSRFISPNKFRG